MLSTKYSDSLNNPQLLGYTILEEIYTSSKTVVYRARQQATQRLVVIKVLRQDYPSFGDLIKFRNQYAIAKNLDIEGIVRPLSLEDYQNGYALVMEDNGSISLSRYLENQTLSLTQILEIAIQLTNILHPLHQRRVIHKDIKPDNILIHPETQRIHLIDFSIASLLPKEIQQLKNLDILEGTLAYIAPEQTGRMNRAIDYRVDFYGFGVTLYELLTGQLPFSANDPLELVHCHIAKLPISPDQIKPNLPHILAKIVLKLLAKNAEDRYQSALGLKHDLSYCLHQLSTKNEISEFTLGQQDLANQFNIPEKLYGREPEVQNLLAAFERVASGTTEMMLVAGFSGIGKTAVIHEVHKPIVKQRGYFIKGKFDQFNRNLPLSAFIQAFRDLIEQLLSESDHQLQAWSTKILAAVGENGQVLIEVIPELEKLIGQQPPVPELLGNAAQNRFNLLLQKFVQVLSNHEHPVVIFLDDLQWADLASLNLLKLLMAETKYLLILGAYRDNEVTSSHPLSWTIEEITKEGGKVSTIELSPLSESDLNQLVADTLHCSLAVADPLTQLIAQKTQGNPFFVTQFLKALYEENLINFNWEIQHWQCDILQVKALVLTEDIVEFMARQLQKLSPKSQTMLKLAACIGAQFDLKTLAIVSQQSEAETAIALWQVLQEGLILPLSDTYKFYQLEEIEALNVEPIAEHYYPFLAKYKFLHDRVQQAAYSLIDAEQKQVIHYQIGRLLWENTPESELEKRIFMITNHLNLGVQCIQSSLERDRLAQLNLLAGKKAKASTAYHSALNHLQQGINLLPVEAWEQDYQLALNLYQEAAETAYLQGNFTLMNSFAQQVLDNAKTLSDTVRIYEVKIEADATQYCCLEAIDTAMEFLQKVNISFPLEPTEQDLERALQETQACLQGKEVAQLIDLPEMQEPEFKAALQVLVRVDTPAYLARPQLHRLLVLKEVALSVQYGNTPASALAYSAYALMLCGQAVTIPLGYEFSKLALQLLAKFGDQEYQAKILLVVHLFVTHWTNPLSTTLEPLKQCYTSGLARGDLAFAGYGALIYCIHCYMLGQELTKLNQEFANYGSMLVEIHQKTALNCLQVYHQVIVNLLESKPQPWQLIGEIYDETIMLTLHQQTNDGAGLWHFYTQKTLLYYLFNFLELAGEYSERASEYLSIGYTQSTVPVFIFYRALVKLALCERASQAEKIQILQAVEADQKVFAQWVEYAPMNQLHRFQLIEAERYRVLGDKSQAIEYYDQAIATAKLNKYLMEEALANELAAKFYLAWGQRKLAAVYMQSAYYCYMRWGAKAKTDDLEQRYAQLLQPIESQRQLSSHSITNLVTTIGHPVFDLSNSITKNISTAVDFSSILKATQAISSKIEIDELIKQLTQIILQNSGADLCVLIRPTENYWQVRAITTPEKTELLSQPLAESTHLPLKLIQYLKNTQNVILIDQLETNLPIIDPYLEQNRPQSVLGLPILNQGDLVGILYLQNQATAGVFNQERLLVLNFLCTQAAIALQNADLYQQAQQALTELKQAQLKIVQSEKMSTLGNLVAGVAHEINNPIGFISGNLTEVKATVTDLIEHLNLYRVAAPASEIEDHAEEIDLDYITEDLPKMLNSMEVGCDRIKEISKSLRTFSRVDKDYKVNFQLHQGIDSTLLILKHRLKGNEHRPEIKIIKNYGNLPQIQCFPGQLNQVFTNLFANAIDVFDEAAETSNLVCSILPPTIQVKTSLLAESHQVEIRIQDNGKGISEQVKAKIFDQGFTTKGVGKGTGLGLAITYQIVVDNHNGQIHVNSELERGTEFVIILPIS